MEKGFGRKFYLEEEFDFLELIRFEVVMGFKVVILEGGMFWFELVIESLDEVKSFIEKMEKIDVKKVVIFEFLKEKEDYENLIGKKLIWGYMIRGFVIIVISLLGIINFCMLLMDELEFMDEFFKILKEKFVEYIKNLRGYCEVEYNGIVINDDNCFLFFFKFYERYCVFILESLFKNFVLRKEDMCY